MFYPPSRSTGETGACQPRTEAHPLANKPRQQTQAFLCRLEDHLIAQYGEEGALMRAQMLFDACGPGRNIDPKVLFQENSEGDDWSEVIANTRF